jgi:hypothetical protein
MDDSAPPLVPRIEELASRLRAGAIPEQDEAELLEWALGVAAQVVGAVYDDQPTADPPGPYLLAATGSFTPEPLGSTTERDLKIITFGTPPKSGETPRGREL